MSGVDATWKPDPMRAHGAWIYLFASIGAGSLIGAERGVEPAMLVGTGYVGAFLVVAAIDSGVRRKGRQALVGASLLVLAPLGALALGSPPTFYRVAAFAALPAICVVVLARRIGPLARTTLVVGVAALTISAPTTAVAGEASMSRSMLLFGLLWTFYCWRTLSVAASLNVDAAWDRKILRARGLREAAIAAVWALMVAMSLRIF